MVTPHDLAVVTTALSKDRFPAAKAFIAMDDKELQLALLPHVVKEHLLSDTPSPIFELLSDDAALESAFLQALQDSIAAMRSHWKSTSDVYRTLFARLDQDALLKLLFLLSKHGISDAPIWYSDDVSLSVLRKLTLANDAATGYRHYLEALLRNDEPFDEEIAFKFLDAVGRGEDMPSLSFGLTQALAPLVRSENEIRLIVEAATCSWTTTAQVLPLLRHLPARVVYERLAAAESVAEYRRLFMHFSDNSEGLQALLAMPLDDETLRPGRPSLAEVEKAKRAAKRDSHVGDELKREYQLNNLAYEAPFKSKTTALAKAKLAEEAGTLGDNPFKVVELQGAVDEILAYAKARNQLAWTRQWVAEHGTVPVSN
jgi:hypothetical protein